MLVIKTNERDCKPKEWLHIFIQSNNNKVKTNVNEYMLQL